MTHDRTDVAGNTLTVLALGTLIAASFWILRPFLGATIWATMIVVATWPLLLRTQARLWNHRWMAVMVMTLLMLLVFVVPFSLVADQIARNAPRMVGWMKSLTALKMPAAPEWMTTLPLVGQSLASAWSQVAESGIEDIAGSLAPYSGGAARWLMSELGSLGAILVQFMVTLVLAAVLYMNGEVAGDYARRLGGRLAGTRGSDAVVLAGMAIRSVALGIGLTAVLQAVLGGIGLAIVGVPFAALLTAVMFMLCIAQVGPTPVLVPVVVWLFWHGTTGWAVFLLIWTAVVATMDHLLRPLLIRRGAHLPLLLIFAGVIGGLVAFGLVGLFVGPVVLAVAYTFLRAWLDDSGTALSGPGAALSGPGAALSAPSAALSAPSVAQAGRSNRDEHAPGP